MNLLDVVKVEPPKHHDWETLIDGNNEITERMRVPGGWIYRSWINANTDTLAMVFVPEVGR